MPFVEIHPNTQRRDRIMLSPRRGGGCWIGFGADVVRRNKLGTGQRVRVLIDVDATPRLIRIVRDDQGPFAIRALKAGAGVLAIPAPPGISVPATFERARAEWDEVSDRGVDAIEIEMPREWQAPRVVAHQPVGNGRTPPGKAVTLPRVREPA